MKIEVLTPTIEQGNIGSSGNSSSTSRVRSKDYLYFENIAAQVKSVTITAQSASNKTILVDLLGYTSNTTSTPIFDLYWYENGHAFDVAEYTSVKYFRVVLKYEDNSDMSPSEIISLSVNLLYEYEWIQGANGYPTNTKFLPLPEKAMADPYPLSLWRIENAELKTGLMSDLPKKAMTKPYPLALWRIDPTANDGYPFTELMPNIEKINLWIQPSRPLIHVYGTNAVKDSDFDSNGYAIFEPISAEVYQERNGEYSATFETHCDKFKKFAYIRKQALVKIPIKYHGKVRQQIFRVIDTVRRMNSDGTYRITAQAVHLFYGNNRFLIKSSHPTQMTGADALPYIANHSTYNTEAYPYICTSDIQLTRTAYYDNMSITEALLGADQAFVNRWGGKLYRDNFYYSINKETEGYQTAGVIEYGYNLTDIEFEEDDTDIITDLIAEDNFGNKYHASVPDNELTVPHRIFKYETFSYDVESVSTFHADAEAYLEEYKQSTVSITVNFLNLSNLDKYKQFRSLDSYEVGDKVILYHKDLDIYYSNLEIISKKYDVLTQKTLEIEIGRFKNAISRRPFMSETATGGQTAADKQNTVIQNEIKDTKLKMLSTWRGARAFAWREISKFTWKEVSKNGNENNES